MPVSGDILRDYDKSAGREADRHRRAARHTGTRRR
jgi:hypothetical protein